MTRICHYQRFCVRWTQNSNLPKRPYPDGNNRKSNISSDSCSRNECNQDKKINSHVELFWTFNSIKFHTARERSGWCVNFISNSSTVIVSGSKIIMPFIFHLYKGRHSKIISSNFLSVISQSVDVSHGHFI